MDKVPYISERITNLAELEKLIDSCYIQAQILKKESPHKEDFQLLVDNLKSAKNFEFHIEKRKINYCE